LGQDGRVTSDDLVGEAIGELYSADPEDFTRRRGELAAAARAAGQAAAARQIAGLRKPTRSAWVINQLARSDPEAASSLAELGAELRDAERSGDGSTLRELSQARRRLIAALVRQALTVSGQHAAPAAMREEITTTLAAALADPEVAEQIRSATLLRPAQRAGFGSVQAPALALVPPPADTRQAGVRAGESGRAAPAASQPAAGTAAAGTAAAAAAETGRTGAARGRRASSDEALAAAERDRRDQAEADGPQAGDRDRRDQAEADAKADEALAAAGRDRRARAAAEAEADAERQRRAQAEAERAMAEAERARRQARAEAEQALDSADRAVQATRTAEQELQDTVKRLEQQLTDLRHRLQDARAQARQAQIAQRKARQVLGRLPE
jgi:hypothetical protein